MPEPDTLSLKIAGFVGYGLCSIISLMFIRNFINFPVALVPLILELAGLSLLGLKVARGYKFNLSIPKPSWMDALILVACITIAVRHVLYFQRFSNGIYTQYYSGDLLQHINDSTDYANGMMPVMRGQILYWGFYFVASVPISFGMDPRESVRMTMILLAVLSPLFMYLATWKLFGSHRTATISAVLWSGVDFTWYRMTVDLSLYPNFFGMISSLILIAAVKNFMKTHDWIRGASILVIAISTAYMSHYSTLFLIFPLVLYALLSATKDGSKYGLRVRGLLIFGGLLIPVFSGGFLFSNLASGLFSALSGLGGYVQYTTPLSLAIPLPSLSYVVGFINNDILALLLFGNLGFCVWLVVKRQDEVIAFLIGWFAIALVMASLADGSWRISIVMLLPLTIMAGFTSSLIIDPIANILLILRGWWYRR